jgi:hypothetical protein
MTCNFTSRLDLLPFEHDPNADLPSLITNCSDVCLLVYGSGNPDLAGIGVRRSPPPGTVNRLSLTIPGNYLLYFPTRTRSLIRAHHNNGRLHSLSLPPRSQHQPLRGLAQPPPRDVSVVAALVCDLNIAGVLHSAAAGIVFDLRDVYHQASGRVECHQLPVDVECVPFPDSAGRIFCAFGRCYLCLYRDCGVSAPGAENAFW